MSDNKEKYIQFAKLAAQTERFDDMAQSMKKVVELDVELSIEERNLFSLAYKNAVGARRSNTRVISAIEKKIKPSEEKQQIFKEYRGKVEKEMRDLCNDVLELISKYLLPKANSPELKVFYLKMEGDYYRYLAEVATGDDRNRWSTAGQAAYFEALELAKSQIAPTNPIRLGPALNYSVFFYEIAASPDRACQLAEQAYEEAVTELDTLSENAYKDSALIMQLIRDNLTLWTTSNTYADDQESGTEDSESGAS